MILKPEIIKAIKDRYSVNNTTAEQVYNIVLTKRVYANKLALFAELKYYEALGK